MRIIHFNTEKYYAVIFSLVLPRNLDPIVLQRPGKGVLVLNGRHIS